MAITQADIDNVSLDFDDLLGDIQTMVPANRHLDLAILYFEAAKAAVLAVLRQEMHRPSSSPTPPSP